MKQLDDSTLDAIAETICGHALRESRNIVHPYVQRLSKDRPDGDTCRICWQVVRAAVADLLEVDKQSGGAAQP
jgi:hypothetical protein